MRELILACAALALALTTIAAFSRRVGGAMLRFCAAPVRWVMEQSEAARQTKVIVKELTTNSGSSLKDAVLRIDSKVQTIDAKMLEDGQRVRALMQDNHDGIFEADPKGNFIWVNRTFCRFLDRQFSELVGRGWEQCVAPVLRSEVVKEWDRCMAVGREFNRPVHFQTFDGSHVWLHCHSYQIVNRKGDITGYMGYARLIEPPAAHESVAEHERT